MFATSSSSSVFSSDTFTVWSFTVVSCCCCNVIADMLSPVVSVAVSAISTVSFVVFTSLNSYPLSVVKSAFSAVNIVASFISSVFNGLFTYKSAIFNVA